MSDNIKKILFTGGGSGGPVSPLLAIAEDLSIADKYKYLWVGTKDGPEEGMVSKLGIEFKKIPAGKFRRYFSWQNFADLFKIFTAFFISLFLILRWKPNIVMTAGAYVSVPVIWAAKILRIPVIIHQQDVRPGLANKLMAPFSNVITVTFEKSLEDYNENAVWTGNPIRKSIRDMSRASDFAFDYFKLNRELKTILIVGGGTGALAINALTESLAEKLSKKYNTILITGKNKEKYFKYPKRNFHIFEFLNVDDFSRAVHASDVVISRAGMGLLSELAYLSKPSIIIPIPESHQEDNAQVLYETDSAIILDQNELNAEKLLDSIENLLNDNNKMSKIGKNLNVCIKSGDGKEIVKIINNL